jgi:hypothetical protein
VAFANIPRESDQADSRVYVAGTEEAREAVLDAHVPQTAAVTRGEVDMEVEYDGDPVFQPVDGTDLVYIENTGSTVLLSDDLYYLVEDGVWYVSVTPNGPWQVSTHRPAQVETILPTSPVYNVKYVHVYDSTPNVVYVGYTPGYTGSYVYHNTIFYGSGWYYQPWVSPYYYYPRHSTWGFNVSYNPWSGWGFGLSWGWGPFSVGYYSGGYWGTGQGRCIMAVTVTATTDMAITGMGAAATDAVLTAAMQAAATAQILICATATSTATTRSGPGSPKPATIRHGRRACSALKYGRPITRPRSTGGNAISTGARRPAATGQSR